MNPLLVKDGGGEGGGVLDCCFIGAWLLEFLKLKGLTHFQKIGPFLSDTSEITSHLNSRLVV